MYQPGDVCGATESPAHPLVSDVTVFREVFLSFFFLDIENSACLSCDCTKRAVILLSLLPWDAERGSANKCARPQICFCCVINWVGWFICSDYYSFWQCVFITWLIETYPDHGQGFNTSNHFYWLRSIMWCKNPSILPFDLLMQMFFLIFSTFETSVTKSLHIKLTSCSSYFFFTCWRKQPE